ncbi:MAG: hypothetical protein HY903_20895 [Deltaproteobacteria bacterium]|nr:hypothetical protein [Deltaproteobacteria bacterium]
MVTFDIEADPLYPRVCAAGASLRRIERATEPDAEGRRSIWHQGKELTEITSWEDARGTLERQELLFMGYAVDYRSGQGLRTGAVKDGGNGAAMPGIDLIEFSAAPSQRIVELAARLLREAKRDYYTQHLLQHLNDALTTRFNRPQTQVYELRRWRQRLNRASQRIFSTKRRHNQIAVYVGAGVIAGAILTAAILAFTRR